MVKNNGILSMSNVNKSFPGVKALDAVSISIHTGEIHGLVGENGAGKSTLIKILAGVYTPDAGSITISGAVVSPITPESIHQAGVRFIHQELHLVPYFTVAEAVFMGQEIKGTFGLAKAQMKAQTETFFKEFFNIDIDGNTLIKHLTVTERKLVQIARALIDNEAKVIVFDEPTAALGGKEAKQLIDIIEKLKQRDVAIIYISHYLSEITDICDNVTVLRNGQLVDVVHKINKNSAQKLIKLMVGREIATLYPKKQRVKQDDISLKVRDLSDGSSFSKVSFDVHKGEIIGIAGLLGSGREELVDVIYGLKRPVTGERHIHNVPIHIQSPFDAVSNGMVLVPRDRRKSGLVLDMDATENINLGSYEQVAQYTIENKEQSQQRAQQQVDNLDIRPAYLDVIAENFSGGNQQKIVLGRWLCTDADIFIFDEPTVGVDVGAKSDIYQLIENLAIGGASVIISSSDPAELIGMCDRILVMKRGTIEHEVATKGLMIDHLIDITTKSEMTVGGGQ